MPSGAQVHVRRRLPVSLNLPLSPRRYGLSFSTAANQGFLAVATPPRKGAWGCPCTPAHDLCSSPFRFIIIIAAQGDFSRTSSRTSQADHCSSYHFRHLSRYRSHHHHHNNESSNLVLSILTRLQRSFLSRVPHACRRDEDATLSGTKRAITEMNGDKQGGRTAEAREGMLQQE